MKYTTKKEKLIAQHRVLHFLKHNNSSYTKKQLFTELITDDVYNLEENAITLALNLPQIKKTKIKNTLYYTAKQLKRKLDFSIFKDIDSNMTFGVEFEFGCDLPDDIFKSMFDDLNTDVGIHGDSNVHISSNNTNDYSKWTLTYDSSIQTRMDGQFELISPVLSGLNGLIQLHKVTTFLNFLKKAGLAHQNDSCGTHIHHGTFNVSINKLIENFTSNQSHFDEFVKKTRVISKTSNSKIEQYNNVYQTIYRRRNFLEMFDGHFISAKKEDYYKNNDINWGHSKYYNLRLNNYKKNGTIEMRQLEGITYFTKIAFWIIIGQRVIKSSKNKVSTIRKKKTIGEFISFLGMKELQWA